MCGPQASGRKAQSCKRPRSTTEVDFSEPSRFRRLDISSGHSFDAENFPLSHRVSTPRRSGGLSHRRRQILLRCNLNKLYAARRTRLDQDPAFATGEGFGDQLDQFLVRFAVDRRGFELRQPHAAVRCWSGQRARTGIGLHLNLNDSSLASSLLSGRAVRICGIVACRCAAASVARQPHVWRVEASPAPMRRPWFEGDPSFPVQP